MKSNKNLATVRDSVGPKSFPIVGVGASAGGLEAFTQLLQHLPVDTGMGWVLVQHLDPAHESALTQLLSKTTSMPVREVTNDLRVKPNHVYVIPPNTCMAIVQGVLKLRPRSDQGRTPHHSIDVFFESLAKDQQERAVAIVLSGTASDGTIGLEAVKAEGGITFAQDDTAKYDSMPRSAVAAGCVDFVLSPKNIAKELTRIAKHPYVRGAFALRKPEERASKRGASSGKQASAGETLVIPEENGFKKILHLLHNHSGVDFSLYKVTTIHRRVTRRMVLNKQNTLEDYASFLRGKAQELDALYLDVLIGVTGFFRNPEAFEVLKRKVFPKLLQQKRDEPLRAWVLGCSTGQEAYSIAMLFMEFAEKIVSAPNIQIFATDLNEAMLDKARAGLYAKSVMQDVSPERLRRFFVEEQAGYRINRTLRESVVFARQNLITDPPFSRMDLISCRNLMIYLEPDLQKKLLPTFHYALKPGGFLFLGSSESIGGFVNLFAPFDKKQKIFSKIAGPSPAFHLPISRRSQPAERKTELVHQPGGTSRIFQDEANAQREADRLTINQFAPPGVLIDANLQILQFRGSTSVYLEPPTGKASFHVLKMAREGLMLPLRAAINKAKKENQRVRRENVHLHQNGTTHTVNIEIIPLKNLKERCYLVLFEEAKTLQKETKETKERQHRVTKTSSSSVSTSSGARRTSELERELSETRDYLQHIQEQSEVATEELQAANEESQSANEELQSMNEELQTSKEELESTNEELITVNEEMANRNLELNRLNDDLLNLETSVHTAIVLLGRDLTIRRFTPLAEKTFNLLAVDIGRSLGGVKVNFDFPELEEWIIEVINSLTAREREVQDNHGRWYSLRARPYLTPNHKIDGAVLMLVDIESLKQTEEKVKEAHNFAQAIVDDAPPLLILDKDLRVISSNRAFYEHFKVSPAQTEKFLVYELGNGQWNIPKLRALLADVLPRNSFFKDFEVTHKFEAIGRRTMLLSGHCLDNQHQILLFIDDITERVESQDRMRASELRYRRLFESAKDGILILDPDTRKITDANPFIGEILGYANEEFIGKELWEFGLLKDEADSKVTFKELQEKRFIRYEDLPLKTKDGRTIQVEFVGNLYRENEKAVIQCNIRDITARRSAESALKEAKEQIDRHAANLEREVADRTTKLRDSIKSLESLTYTMAHDLRAPIHAMKGLSGALLEDVPLNDEGKNYAEKINKAAERMDQLINDLLDYGQLTHVEFPIHSVDLKTQIEKVLFELSQGIQAANAEIQVQKPLPIVSGNKTLVEQILSNILSNALKFVAPGVKPHILIRAETRDSMARLWVEDNGIGIAPQYQDKIFGVFQRLHITEDFPGTGVGLAICKRAIERMDGRMGVESEPGKGSKFWIELQKPKENE